MGKRRAVKLGRSSFDDLDSIKAMSEALETQLLTTKISAKNYEKPTDMSEAVLNALNYSSIALNYKDTGKGIHSLLGMLKNVEDDKNQLELVNSLLCSAAMFRSLGFHEFSEFLLEKQLPIVNMHIVDKRMNTVEKSLTRSKASQEKNKSLIDMAEKIWTTDSELTVNDVTEQLENSRISELSFDRIHEIIKVYNPNKGQRGRRKTK
jgi:5'(3')-deoxyribonucleotidase